MRHSVSIILFVILSAFATAQAPDALKKKFSISRQLTHDYFVFKKSVKSGLVNRTGTIILPAVYDDILFTRFNLFVVKKGKQQGIVNAQNKVILPFNFDGIYTLNPDRIHVSKGDFYFVVSSSNHFIADTTEAPAIIFQQAENMFTPPRIVQDVEVASEVPAESQLSHNIKKEYQDLKNLTLDGRLFKFREHDLWGIVDKNGKELIPPTYHEIAEDYNTKLIIVSEVSTHRLLTPGLKPIAAGPFETIDVFNEEGFAIVRMGGKTGLINSSGKLVIKTFNGWITPYGDHHFQIKYDTASKMDIIDRALKSILPPGTTSTGFSGNIILLANKEGKMGAMHAAGYILVPPVYDEIFYGNTDGESISFFKVRKGTKWGALDFQQKEIIPFEYSEINLFKDGYAPAKRDGQSGAITISNEIAVPFIYDRTAYEFNKYDLLHVVRDYKHGFVDKKGKVIIPLQYDQVDEDFEGDLSMSKKGTKWGYIDKDGKEVIPFEYDETRLFYGQKTKVRKDKTWYEIDKTGKVLGETTP